MLKNPKDSRWLLLIHQIPPKPAYFRVKIWRHLQKIGAVAIKNSVYALPKNESTQELFQWVIREILESKGEATLCEANFVDGLTDQEIEALFNSERDSEYQKLSEEVKKKLQGFPKKAKITANQRKDLETNLAKVKQRLSEITSIDFFGASGRETAFGLVIEFENEIRSTEPGSTTIGKTTFAGQDLQGRTWITRKGIHVDRMACAWLIKRFIDSRASFKYVDGKTYQPQPRELRFDMFEAEFTHEGDRCTFEVLLERTNLKDPSLKEISEIIHDLDLKDSKFGRQDAVGINELITGIALTYPEDEVRLSRSSALFDDLYEYFKRRRK